MQDLQEESCEHWNCQCEGCQYGNGWWMSQIDWWFSQNMPLHEIARGWHEYELWSEMPEEECEPSFY